MTSRLLTILKKHLRIFLGILRQTSLIFGKFGNVGVVFAQSLEIFGLDIA